MEEIGKREPKGTHSATMCHCLSPVGLSTMTKLAPARIGRLIMGVWFLSMSVGDYIGGRLSCLYESLPLPSLFGIVAAI
jgi:POT family proton-dependent oligopeptide transporter